MQKTVTGILQILIKEIDIQERYIKMKVNLLNRKGEVMWTSDTGLGVGDSLNLMTATFRITLKEE